MDNVYQRVLAQANAEKKRKQNRVDAQPRVHVDVWWWLFLLAVRDTTLKRPTEIAAFGKLAGLKRYQDVKELTEHDKQALLWKEGRIQGCSKCNEVLPKTDDYFYQDGRGKFRTWCKSCDNKARQARREAMRRRAG